MIPEWYKELLGITMAIGLLVVLPLVLIFGPEEEREIKVKEKYYCYFNSCDSIAPVFGLTYSEVFDKYVNSFHEVDSCLIFSLDKKTDFIKPYLFQVPVDSQVFVYSFIKDSTIARLQFKIKVKAYDSQPDHYYVWVPIYTLHKEHPYDSTLDICVKGFLTVP